MKGRVRQRANEYPKSDREYDGRWRRARALACRADCLVIRAAAIQLSGDLFADHLRLRANVIECRDQLLQSF